MLKKIKEINIFAVDSIQARMQHFLDIRKNIIGINHSFTSPFGKKKILYADWTASGRMYRPIEDYMMEEVYPYVANTHTETTYTGSYMTNLYHNSLHDIKSHVGATNNEVIIASNSGMTGVINKFQRILGYKLHEKFEDRVAIGKNERPVVFITHMEHHSNHTTWLETICDVVIIPPTKDGDVDLEAFDSLMEDYKSRETKIASVTACSNVTGIYTPYHKIAAIAHKHGGYCFVDFACSGPYVDINMNPENEAERLDAVFLSPHKFLGGPGTSGVVVFRKELYNNAVPDHPGGGTVRWTSPFEKHLYLTDIEMREDGGTPPFLQTIRVAKAIELKEYMGTANIAEREEKLMNILWDRVSVMDGVTVLESNKKHRQAILSLQFNDLYFNQVVRSLNDIFGIQSRGGCSCAGTYGHYLNNVDYQTSIHIRREVEKGNALVKPGWVRISLHPTMLEDEMNYIADAIQFILDNKTLIGDLYQVSGNDFELDESKLQSADCKHLFDRSFVMA